MTAAANSIGEDWRRARLGDIIQIHFGVRITRKDNAGTEYPVYGGGGESFRTDTHNRENEYVVSRFALSENNCVRYVSGKFYMLDSGFTFSVQDADVANKDFVGRFLLSRQGDVFRQARGAAQKNLDMDSFVELQIPLPPLREQKRVARILQIADDLRAKRQKSIVLIDEFTKASFYHLFGDPVTNPKGWEFGRIGDFVEPTTTWNPQRNGEGVFHYIDIGAIDRRHKTVSAAQQYECAKAPGRARQKVAAGDVIVSTVRPNLNAVACIQDEHDGMTVSTGFCVLRPNRAKIEPAFLFEWVKTLAFVQAMTNAATGANYPAVTDKKVKAASILIPPLPLQQKFAAIAAKAQTQKTKMQSHANTLTTLYASLQQQAFGR